MFLKILYQLICITMKHFNFLLKTKSLHSSIRLNTKCYDDGQVVSSSLVYYFKDKKTIS